MATRWRHLQGDEELLAQCEVDRFRAHVQAFEETLSLAAGEPAGKPVRITSLQSVTGGVFNNSDILRIDYGEEYDVKSAADEAESHVLDLKAKTGQVAYDRLKMWVDRKLLLPTKIEAYAASGLLIKTIRFSDIKDFGGGIRRPATVETDSPMYKGYKSVMLYSALKRRELSDEVFTLTNLPRIEDLRK